MVRLKAKFAIRNHTAFRSFNSNMVRLKVEIGTNTSLPRWFQFQYGTIKRSTFHRIRTCFIVSIPIWYD